MSKYINQISDADITDFLDHNGYTLVNYIKDAEGNFLPAIDKSEDCIYVRCQRVQSSEKQQIDTELAYYLMKKYPGFMSFPLLLRGQYSSDAEMLVFSDFDITKLCLTEEDLYENYRLLKAYYSYMSNRFVDYNQDLVNIQDNSYSEDNHEM